MKKLLNQFPRSKNNELEKIVEIVRNVEPRIEMIILFGSHARGEQVDDRYVEDDRVYSYKSDFDLLLVVKDRELADDFVVLDEIKEAIRDDEKIQTPISAIIEDISFLNEQLEIGRYFYTDITKDGIILFDSIKLALSKPRKLSKKEYKKIAEGDYNYWLQKANDFFKGYDFYVKDGTYNLAAFNLHQTTEALYDVVLLVFSG